MGIRKYKPITPSLRALNTVNKFHLWKGNPLKMKNKNMFSSSGRNNSGRITMAHRQQGTKKTYRQIKDILDITQKSVITRVEHDPNRSSFISLNQTEKGELFYTLCSQNMKIGDVVDHTSFMFKNGSRLPLKDIPIGTLINNLEFFPNRGAIFVKSAGVFAQLVGHISETHTLIKLPSGEKRIFLKDCLATIGAISNSDWSERVLAKAGRNRWLGKRPHVRGVAMNPVDHPHGGGEGKTGTGRHPVTPTGRLTKGKRTVSISNKSPYIIKRRYQK